MLCCVHAGMAQHTDLSFFSPIADNSLSNNHVNCITQDKYGFLWIATQHGLNRYDGQHYVTYYHDPKDTGSLPHDQVYTLFSDSRGWLWLGTPRGIARFNFDTKKFTAYRFHADTTSYITAIKEDHAGILWVCTKGGLFRFDPLTGKYKECRNLIDHTGYTSYFSNRVTGLACDAAGKIWMSTLRGVYCYDPVQEKFTRSVLAVQFGGKLTSGNLCSMCMDHNGHLWLGSYNLGLNGIDEYLPELDSVVHIQREPLTKNVIAVTQLLEDQAGELWVATEGAGLYNIKPATFEVQSYREDKLNPASLADNKAMVLFQDHSGLMWTGFDFSALQYFSIQPKNFINYFMERRLGGSSGQFNVSDMALDEQGDLEMATDKGLVICNISSNGFRLISDSVFVTDNHAIPNINAVCPDSGGLTWLGTNYGLFRYNRNNGQIKFYAPAFIPDVPADIEPENPNWSQHPVGNIIFHILSVDAHRLMLLGSGGINILDKETGRFRNNYNDTILHNILRRYYEYGVKTKNAYWLLLGSNEIMKMDFQFHVLQIIPDRKAHFVVPSSEVHDMVASDDDHLWLATESGVFALDTRNKTIRGYTQRNGLSSNYCLAINLDPEGNVWVAQAAGISRIDRNGTIVNYPFFENGGVVSIAVHAKLTLDQHTLLFGANKGFTAFHPASVMLSTAEPSVYLTSFLVNGNDLLHGSNLQELHDIVFSYDQNNFRFNMAALSFEHSEKNRFMYRLAGFEKNWNDCGTIGEGNYTNIPPGEYVLEIRGCSSTGVWSNGRQSLHIIIRPPFWQTLWFRLSLLGFVVLLIYLFIRWRGISIREKEKAKNEQERKVLEMKLTAIRAQMNPHFIFNSLNSIQEFISGFQQEEALRYLSKFSKLIRSILQQSNRSTTTVGEELDMLRLYLDLERLRFNEKFDYRIVVQESLDPYQLEVPTMIFLPSVENAVLHGFMDRREGGEILIQLMETEGRIRCVIQDNGIGRAAAKALKRDMRENHISMGIRLMEERIESMKGLTGLHIRMRIIDLFNAQGKPAGTRVEYDLN